MAVALSPGGDDGGGRGGEQPERRATVAVLGRAGGMAEVRSHRWGGHGTHIVSVRLDSGLEVGPVLLALGEAVMQGRVCLVARGRA